MPLTAGARLGSYQIVDSLGEGGMGAVYRARDTRLRRDVAIKILPERFAGDPDRVARFQREAELLATLNHPHIAAIYGVDESSGMLALVLELVEGETLADRVARGPLPLDEALPIARQIVDALEAAHERGIVHRDLKPANIKITPDGNVKVLDFGLAKALDDRSASLPGERADLSCSPTVTAHATYAGVILGTAAYMSPEQARGKSVDRRADIWAFGAVLYEMVTGRQPFVGGDTVSDTIAAILRSEVDWRALPTDTPPAVRKLLRRCLEKDPQKRLPHIGVARLELDEARGAAPPPLQEDMTVVLRERFAWMAATLVLALLVAGLGIVAFRGRLAADPPEMRVEITTPPTTTPTSFAISPDGRHIVFVAIADGPGLPGRRAQLWIRSLESSSARALPGTEGALFPFWSPDSRSVGFFAGAKMRRIDIDGGATHAIADVVTPGGGTWNADGTILFVPNNGTGPIYRVSAAGGPATPISPIDRHDIGLRFPQFLPDGHHYLYYVAGGPNPGGIYVADLATPSERKWLLNAAAPALYGDHALLFVQQGSLFAQRFDPATMQLSGTPAQVADDVATNAGLSVGASTSHTGIVAFRTGRAEGLRELAWFDRSGHRLGTAGEQANLSNPSLSPDGRSVAFQLRGDIWRLDFERNAPLRLTSHPAIDALPVWSADGKRIAFNSLRNGASDLFVKDVDAGTPETVLLASDDDKFACDWSPDGRTLLYRVAERAAATYDLWALPLDGDRKPYAVIRTPFDDRDGQFSPDGKWLAFQSDESGAPEIYVQRFPGPAGRVRVSIGGGTQVRWRRDGRELFYVSPGGQLMAVSIAPTNDATVRAGTPSPLFETKIVAATAILRQQFVVAPDGQRFLINSVVNDVTATPITLLLNWRSPTR